MVKVTNISSIGIVDVFGYIIPIGELGSVTDVDSLCSSTLWQLGQASNEQAKETCDMASDMSKMVYVMMGIGIVVIIIGVIKSSQKQSLFICKICNLAFPHEADLHNHINSKQCLEK